MNGVNRLATKGEISLTTDKTSKRLPTTDRKTNRLPTWADIINNFFQKKEHFAFFFLAVRPSNLGSISDFKSA